MHFTLREGSLEPIRDALVVGAEGYGVAAIEFNARFVVIVADLSELLPNHRLEHLIVAPLLVPDYLGIDAQILVVHVHGQLSVLQDGPAFVENVILYAIGGSNFHFDASVGRSQTEGCLGVHLSDHRHHDS